MNIETLSVHAPTSVVFLCGGAIQSTEDPPLMLRDAFYRASMGSAQRYKLILAEEAKPLDTDAGYSDLLSFESDIAQVVGGNSSFCRERRKLGRARRLCRSQNSGTEPNCRFKRLLLRTELIHTQRPGKISIDSLRIGLDTCT